MNIRILFFIFCIIQYICSNIFFLFSIYVNGGVFYKYLNEKNIWIFIVYSYMFKMDSIVFIGVIQKDSSKGKIFFCEFLGVCWFVLWFYSSLVVVQVVCVYI